MRLPNCDMLPPTPLSRSRMSTITGPQPKVLLVSAPLIIMDYTEHHQNQCRELLDPEHPADESPILDPEIREEKLEYLYSQIADILLQSSSLKFP